MTATSAVNAIQYPDLTNVKDQVAQFATMNTNVDTSIVPRFANASARAAAITSPTEGQFAYLTQESILTYYTGVTLGWVTAETSKTLRKLTVESITAATTVMNADDAMYFYADSNSKYVFEIYASVTGDTAVNALKSAWTGPTGAVMSRNVLNMSAGQTNRNNTTMTIRTLTMTDVNTTGTHSSAGVAFVYCERGLIVTSSTPGIIQWTWGKPTAYASALNVSGSSFLTYRKIS